MKPFKLFLFFAMIMLILGIFSWAIPQEGWNMFGLNIQFLKYPAIAQSEESIQLDTSSFVRPIIEVDSLILDTISTQKTKNDTSHFKSKSENKLLDIPIENVQIATDSSDFWVSFAKSVSIMDSTNQQIRILYYGDSQIENDRITSSLRKKLQAQYGGSGRGLVPIVDIYNTANNFIMSVSKNWKRTSVVGSRKKNLDVGIMCESYKINKKQSSKDSMTNANIKIKTIDPSKDGGYTLVRLYYQSLGNSSLEVIKNGKAIYSQKLVSNSKINELKLNFGDNPNHLELKLKTSSELKLYGLSMETPTGIQIDNIALRGKSRPELVRGDTTNYNQMSDLLKPSFVILHYGVNVVPNVSSNYGFYRNMLTADIQFLKQHLPNVPILLISASDMAHREKGELVSYANIPKVVNAQKQAAFRNKCAFWNLYETMGGEGSMIEWVGKIPPLGNKDYTHFTPLGASEVGEILAKKFRNTKTKRDN